MTTIETTDVLLRDTTTRTMTWRVRLAVLAEGAGWRSDDDGMYAEFDDEDIAASLVRLLMTGHQRRLLAGLARDEADRMGATRASARIQLVEHVDEDHLIASHDVVWHEERDEVVAEVAIDDEDGGDDVPSEAWPLDYDATPRRAGRAYDLPLTG